jgi:hypothetical protein
MAISLSSPVTGAAATGLTSPTYTVAVDQPPNAYSKQWAVTALGGTQTNVDISSASRPFTFTFGRPANVKVLAAVDVTNVLRVVPINTYTARTRKGVTPLAGQMSRMFQVVTNFGVPAGSDLADAVNLAAGCSLHIGALSQLSSGIVDSLKSASI